jgi:SNF2 family DNA or RNA helicase
VVSLDPKKRASFVKAVEGRSADIYIMHWDALRLIHDSMRPVKWFHIVGDEIHRVKNRKAKMTVCLKQLKTFYKTGMSGTPADNKPHDLWSILNWLYPNEFRSYWKFYKHYVQYEVTQDGYYKVIGVYEEKLPELHREMAPFFIRRRKSEVAKDIPPTQYATLWVDLSPAQRKAYNEMRKDMLTWIGEQDQSQPIAAPSAITRLVRLQQFALASIRTEERTRRKLNRDWEAYREAWDEKYPLMAGDYPDVGTDWRFHQWRVEDYIAYLLENPSSKIDAAMDVIANTEDRPLVFFSQFKTMNYLFARHLREANIPHAMLTGDATKDQRGQMVRDFQAGKLKVFTGTIAAGGIGITLTRATDVFFFDRAWNPAFNLQAEDRLHRIGQTNTVNVYDIMARNTLDFGRVQGINLKWTNIQKMLGDKVFDYQRQQIRDQGNLTLLQQIAQQIG